jgi:hypothetical protein
LLVNRVFEPKREIMSHMTVTSFLKCQICPKHNLKHLLSLIFKLTTPKRNLKLVFQLILLIAWKWVMYC